MNFDLDSLLSAKGLGLAALFLVLLFAVRGLSAMLWLRELGHGRRSLSASVVRGDRAPADRRDRRTSQRRRRDRDGRGASLVGAGMISVLTFPLLGMHVAGGEAELPHPEHGHVKASGEY